MSRPDPDRVDVLAVSEQDVTGEDCKGWTLRYLLCRIRVGGAQAFALRVHARPQAGGPEQCAVAGLDVPDAQAAEVLFWRLARGGVFPAHLQDIVHDAPGVAPAVPVAAMASPAR